MQAYIDLTKRILNDGEWKPTRTAQKALYVPASFIEFDLREGFPAVTVKKLAYHSMFAELVGFMRGCSNVADFNALGTKVWDANAQAGYWTSNPHWRGPGDLGRIYGVQWRNWRPADYAYGTPAIDQLAELIEGVRSQPFDRRHIVTAWNPGELDQMALPPCHVLFQVLVSPSGYLDLLMYQRSCDVFLGLPFNIASYAALQSYIAKVTGFTPRRLSITIADAHLYENQIEAAQEMVKREPLPMPTLYIAADPGDDLSKVNPNTFILSDYKSHPAIHVPMVV